MCASLGLLRCLPTHPMCRTSWGEGVGGGGGGGGGGHEVGGVSEGEGKWAGE